MYSQAQLEQLLDSADREAIYETLFLNFDESKIPELLSILHNGSASDFLAILLEREPSEALFYIEELIEELLDTEDYIE